RMESLQASNERARSAEVLATRAEKLGMVGVASAPILTRGSDGVIEIVGEPEAELGAPIKQLQPAPVSSDSSTPPARDGFDAPPAPTPQDRAERGASPVPYPPLAAPPAASAPPPPGAEREPAPAEQPDAPAPEPAAAPAPGPEAAGDDPATLAPVPGTTHGPLDRGKAPDDRATDAGTAIPRPLGGPSRGAVGGRSTAHALGEDPDRRRHRPAVHVDAHDFRDHHGPVARQAALGPDDRGERARRPCG